MLENLFNEVKKAHQKRVDLGLVPALQYNEAAALKFSYHTSEEVTELIREFPLRKEWKAYTPVDREKALSELVDVFIMSTIVAHYLEVSAEELNEGVLNKLGVKRTDWIV